MHTWYADLFSKLTFSQKIKIRNTWRHQSAKSVGSRPGPAESRSGLIEADLGPNCLQRLSADYKSVKVLGYSAGVDLLLIVTPIVGFCNCSMFCCTLLYVHSSFAALLSLPSWCLVIVVWLCLAVPWVCLQFVIVVFPYHTHLLFL